VGDGLQNKTSDEGAWLMSDVSQIALWIVVATQTLLILGLMREVGLIQLRVGPSQAGGMADQGLPAGTQVPEISARRADGSFVTVGGEPGRPQLLVFVSPSCGICHEMITPVRVLAQAERNLDVLAVCGATTYECMDFFKQKVKDFTLVADPENAVKRAFKISGSPFGLLLDRNGVVCGSGIVNNLPQLEYLLRSLTNAGEFIPASLSADGRPRTLVGVGEE
jgi:methylamine dehydrogenase accessory protein MauD